MSTPVPVTDAMMQAWLAKAAPRLVFVLKKGPRFDDPSTMPQQWEHARHMFARLSSAEASFVCPIMDGSDIAGFGVFANDSEALARDILDADPAVAAGRITYELVHGAPFSAPLPAV